MVITLCAQLVNNLLNFPRCDAPVHDSYTLFVNKELFHFITVIPSR